MNKFKFESLIDTLKVPYYDVFDEISAYILNSNVPRFYKKEVMNDILDMFLNAQERGENIYDVIGTKNLKSFCDDIIEELNYNLEKNQCLKMLNVFLDFFVVIGYYSLYKFVNQLTVNLNFVTLDFILLILGFFTVIILGKKIRKNSFNGKYKSVAFLSCILSLVLMLVFVFLFKNKLNQHICSVPFYIAIGGSYLLYFIGQKYLRKSLEKIKVRG